MILFCRCRAAGRSLRRGRARPPRLASRLGACSRSSSDSDGVRFTLALILALSLGSRSRWCRRRARLRASTLPILVAYGLGALLATPLVVHAMLGMMATVRRPLERRQISRALWYRRADRTQSIVVGRVHVNATARAHLSACRRSDRRLARRPAGGWFPGSPPRGGARRLPFALGTSLSGRPRVVALPWAAAAVVPLLNDALRSALPPSARPPPASWSWSGRRRRGAEVPAGICCRRSQSSFRCRRCGGRRTLVPALIPVRPVLRGHALQGVCVPRRNARGLPVRGRLAPLAGRERFWFGSLNGLHPSSTRSRDAFNADPTSTADAVKTAGRRCRAARSLCPDVYRVAWSTVTRAARSGRARATERVGGAVVAPACRRARSHARSRGVRPPLPRRARCLAPNIGSCRSTYFYELRGLDPPARSRRAARALRRRAGATCALPP